MAANPIGFTSDAANILAAGLNYIWIKYPGDTAYYTLGEIAEGVITAQTLNQVNSKGMPIPFGIDLNVSAKMMITPKTGGLAKLDKIAGATSFSVATRSGKYFTFTGGLKWSFVNSGDYDAYRYIQITLSKRFLTTHATKTDWADIVSTSPASEGADTPGDTLYTLKAGLSLAASRPWPAGFSALEVYNGQGANDAWETLGLITSGRMTCDLLTVKDNSGQDHGYNVHISISADMLQTDEELLLLDDLADSRCGFRATLVDGTILTLTTQTGVSWQYRCDKDSDGPALTTVTGTAIITPAVFVGLVS